MHRRMETSDVRGAGKRASTRVGSAGGAWLRAASALVLALALGAAAPGAETITWNNGSGGAWSTAANWNPQDVPNESGESAIVPAGSGTYTITLDGNVSLDQVSVSNTAATLNLGSYRMDLVQPAGLANSGTVRAGNGAWLNGPLTQTSTGQLLVPTNVSFYAQNTAHNGGSIRVGSLPSSGSARFYVSSYGYTLDGAGELVLVTDGNPEQACLASYYGSLYQGAGHTIRGSGKITLDTHNAGRIDANDGGHVLVLSEETQTNNGTFAATNNGILRFDNITVNQGVNGLILADGGVVRVNGGTISGGTFDSDNGGVIEGYGSAQLWDITTLGQFHVPAGQAAHLRGSTVTNDGTIWINPQQSGSDAFLYVGSYGVTLNGTGDIRLQTTGSDIWDSRLSSYYGTLTQAAGHTIHGEGVVDVNLTNYGLVSADVSGRTLGLYGENKSNHGTFRAVGGATLNVTAPVTQGSDGRLLADGGTVRLASAVTGGRLETTGSSTIDGYSGMTFGEGTLAGRMRVMSSGCELRNVTTDGPVAIVGGGQLALRGTATTNNDRITVNSDASGTDAYLYVGSYSHTLQGSGDILLQTGGADIWDARLQSYYGTLIQSATHTIHGDGVLTVDLRNYGLVSADASGRKLELQCDNLYNYATCKATGGGVLNVVNPIHQEAPGVLLADGGRVTLNTYVYGGSLATAGTGAVECYNGTFLEHVTNQGRVDLHAGNWARMHYSLTNNGTITINSDHTNSDAIFYVEGYGQTLDGTGQIVLQTTGDVWDARFADYYGTLTQAANHTIRGDGVVGIYLKNYGTVLADVAGRTLLLQDQEKFNYGTLRAENGAAMDIQCNLTNTGTAEATGGSLLRAGGAILNYQSGTLTGGAWLVRPNSTMRLLGAAIQRLDARVLLEGPNANLYRDDGTTPALSSLQTIGNDGVLSFSGGPSLTTPGNLAVTWGRLSVGAGSTLTVNGTFTQTGSAEADSGGTRVDGILSASVDPVAITGGRLSGSGTIQNDVLCSGGVAPGSPAGTLAINGDYAQTGAATCYIELGGPNAGEYDRLQVSGQATLSGRLFVKPINGYVPAIGARFTILTFGSRVGTFTVETGYPGVGLQYDTYYYPDRIEIEVYGDPSAVTEPGTADGTGDDPVTPELVVPSTVALTARSQASGQITLALDLPQAAEVELSLFDFNGRRVACLRQGPEAFGRRTFTWNGMGSGGELCPSGIYLARARVQTPDGTTERHARVLIVR
jgi:hypothetical protein